MDPEAVCERNEEIWEHGTFPQGFKLLDVLILLLRRRGFILYFTGAGILLTLIAVLLTHNRYTAASLVIPPAQNTSLSSMLLGQLSGGSGLASVAGAGLGIRNSADMHVSLFRSRTVEDALIQRFGLMARYRVREISDARLIFEERSTVVLGVKDGLIRITVTDRDPKMAADLTNAYVDEFRKQSENLAITEAAQRRLFFQQQLLQANENLANAEDALKHAEQSTGILQIEGQARALIESAATLRGQIAAKEVQLQAVRSYATAENPQVVVAEQELAALKAQLARLTGTNESSSSDIIVPKGNIPQAKMEYIRKLRDLKYYETISELIAKQFEIAKLDEAREGAIVQVADVAVPPQKKSSPHRALIIVLMMLVSFTTAVLLVYADARWGQMVRNPENKEKIRTLRGLLHQKRH